MGCETDIILFSIIIILIIALFFLLSTDLRWYKQSLELDKIIFEHIVNLYHINGSDTSIADKIQEIFSTVSSTYWRNKYGF